MNSLIGLIKKLRRALTFRHPPTLREGVHVNEAIELLNDLLRRDPQATKALVFDRVPCSKYVADHPSLQVRDMGGIYTIGLLGVINGLFGTDAEGQGAISVYYWDEEEKEIIKFERTPTAGLRTTC